MVARIMHFIVLFCLLILLITYCVYTEAESTLNLVSHLNNEILLDLILIIVVLAVTPFVSMLLFEFFYNIEFYFFSDEYTEINKEEDTFKVIYSFGNALSYTAIGMFFIDLLIYIMISEVIIS